MGSKKRSTAAERKQCAITTAQATNRKRSTISKTSRKSVATPKKKITKTDALSKKKQLTNSTENINEKPTDHSATHLIEVDGTKADKRTPTNEGFIKIDKPDERKEQPAFGKEDNQAEITKPEPSKTRTEAEINVAEKSNEKTKAISKMLKNLDIQISGFDNILPSEERIIEGLKSSISENVKTKSRAAAVKVIACLNNSPKLNFTKKIRYSDDDKNAQMPTKKEKTTEVKANKRKQERKQVSVNNSKKSSAKKEPTDNKKKAVARKLKAKNQPNCEKEETNNQNMDATLKHEVEESAVKIALDAQLDRLTESSKCKLDDAEGMDINPSKDMCTPIPLSKVVELKSLERNLGKTSFSKIMPSTEHSNMVKSTLGAMANTEEALLLKEKIDFPEEGQEQLNKDSLRKKIELEPKQIAQHEKKESAVQMKTKNHNNGKKLNQCKYKVTSSNLKLSRSMSIDERTNIMESSKEQHTEYAQVEAKKDIYDFKSGSEEEENIKMDLPTLKNLRELSAKDNKAPKAKTSKEMQEVEAMAKIIKGDGGCESNLIADDKTIYSEKAMNHDHDESVKKAEQDPEITNKKNPNAGRADVDLVNCITNCSKSTRPTAVRKVLKKISMPVLKTVKTKLLGKVKKTKAKPIKKTGGSPSEESDSDDEKKLIVFGQKRHRIASLNALAKVQCLYENESRTAYELGLSKATQLPPKIRTLDGSDDEKDRDKVKERDRDKDKNTEEKTQNDMEKKLNDSTKSDTHTKNSAEEAELEIEPKRELRHVPGGRGVGKHWEFESESENEHIEKLKLKKKKLAKKLQTKKVKSLEKKKDKELTEEKEKMKSAVKETSTPIKLKHHTKVKKSLKKLVHKKNNGLNKTDNSESSDVEDERIKQQESEKLKKLKKQDTQKRSKKRNQLLKAELVDDYKEVLVRKRMAGLNASAIVAATYEVERHLDKNLASDCESFESYDEKGKRLKKTKNTTEKEPQKPTLNASSSTSVEENSTKSQTNGSSGTSVGNHATSVASASSKVPLNIINEDSNDSKYSKETKETNTDTTTTAGYRDSGASTKDAKESSRPTSSSVVIVQDTDVTITGVYVNSTTGSSQEAYCKMQYRVQSSVTEERVLRPNSADPPKSYTPLSALSNMLPPGTSSSESHVSSPSSQQTPGGPLTDPLNPATLSDLYHASDLGLHTEHVAPEHGPPPPSYAAAAAAAATAYHTHHISPATVHNHRQYHAHHQYQQASEHVMHTYGHPPPHHYQPYGPPPPSHITPVQGRCEIGSPPPSYRPSVYGSAPTSLSSLPISGGAGGTSAFCSPNMHHHQPQQQHPQQQQQAPQHNVNASGYYQPAGPLISPHVLPSATASVLPKQGINSKKQQQVATPLNSDPERLQQPPPSTSVSDTDSDVLFSSSDLTPFRYQGAQDNSEVATLQPATAQHHPAGSQQQQSLLLTSAAHQGTPYTRPIHAPVHYSTGYPHNYYTPYPGEPICYSPPSYQPYFPTKVYQNAPGPPPPATYRRYPYYQPGPPHPPPPPDLYDQTQVPPAPTVAAGGGHPIGPPPPEPPPGTQLVPAGSSAHTQHLEHFAGPPGYYSGYSPGPGSAAGQYYARPIQAPYMEYPPQCPCPMQQSCPKNVHTGPHIGSNSSNNNTNNGNNININNANISHINFNNNTALTCNSNSNSNINTIINNNSNSNVLMEGNNTALTTGNKNCNNSPLTTMNLIHNISHTSSNNNKNNVLFTSRGPVKNLLTAEEQQQQQHDINRIELEQHLLQQKQHQQQQQQQQHDNVEPYNFKLLQPVKSELKIEDSDIKSQYEENVVQPLTPPENFEINDDGLLDKYDKEAHINIPLVGVMEDHVDKLQIPNNVSKEAGIRENVLPGLEAYDLTVSAATALSTGDTSFENGINNGNYLNSSNISNSCSKQLPLLGRKARIGKKMAREMVHAGAATKQITIPPAESLEQGAFCKNADKTATNSMPYFEASQIQTDSSNIPQTTNTTTAFSLKQEIKAEKIKIENNFLDTILQPSSLPALENATDFKIIKSEPAISPEDRSFNESTNFAHIATEPVVPSSFVDQPSGTPNEQINYCHNTATAPYISTIKRVNILELHKGNKQCKKSSPNSYKNLIKQALPRTYLCLSRKFDRHSRLRKQRRAHGVGNRGLGNVRRRQLMLTEEQKKLLRRRRKVVANEQRRSAVDRKKELVARKSLTGRRRGKCENSVEKAKVTGKQESRALTDLLQEQKNKEVELLGSSYEEGAENVALQNPTCLLARKSVASPLLKMTKPKKAAATISRHILEAVDTVARGYYSEPEIHYTATGRNFKTKDNHITQCTNDFDESPLHEREHKKLKLSSTEKRSKSETKKLIKSSSISVKPLNDEISDVIEGVPLRSSVSKSPLHPNATSVQLDKSNFTARTQNCKKSPRALVVSEEYQQTTKAASQMNNLVQKCQKTRTNLEVFNKKIQGAACGNTKKTKFATSSPKMKLLKMNQKHPTNALDQMDVPLICEKNNAEKGKSKPKLSLETNNNEYINRAAMNVIGSASQCITPEVRTVFSVPAQKARQQKEQSPLKFMHSNTDMFLQPTQPVPRVVCHHVAKRTRSRSKFGSRKRQKHKHSTVSFELDDTVPPVTRADVVPKWNNGWKWDGEPFQGAVFLNSDDPLVIRTCYPAMRHAEGDIIRTRDCVLLKANEDNELPYVAKVAHLWENPADGEMMMSLLWYYRPEHTEQGRQRNDSLDEVYASRHRDHNSVACIEDKCYVLTFSEYCRYRRRLRAAEDEIEDISIVPKSLKCYTNRTVPDNTNSESVMFCRRAYEFRTKRLLKMPNKQDYYVVTI